MRLLPGLMAMVLVGICLGACGEANRDAHSVPNITTPGGTSLTDTSSTMTTHGYLNDGDAEKFNDHDLDNRGGNHDDGDADSSEEYEDTYDNGGYRDGDDTGMLTYGHAATGHEQRAITPIVTRYFAMARMADGAGTCAMLVPSLAAAVVEDYGRGSAGPSYLRSAKTCPAVMTLLFKHAHRPLAGAVAVTGARVEGDQALALLGSKTMPAGDISVERVGGAWRINSLLGEALP
jgi:hypothetical protein